MKKATKIEWDNLVKISIEWDASKNADKHDNDLKVVD